MNTQKNTAGLSLLELSIVLVVIGLIVGSVVVGRDLIATSQIRSVQSEATAYQAAFQTFYSKYQGLPGDMTNPSQYFSGTWLGGNGNGEIIWTGEGAEAWRQLVQAKLVTGMTNTTCASFCYADPGDTIPASKGFTTGGWTIMYDIDFNRNILLFGAKSALDYMASDPALTPAQASAIDTKFDDNNPNAGRVISKNITPYANCITGNKYNVQTTDIICNFSITLGK